MSIILRTTLFSLILLCSAANLPAQPGLLQGECMGGIEYLIGLPDTVTNAQDARFPDRDPESFILMIHSPVDQTIKIGRAGGAGKNVPLTGGEVYHFDLKEVGVPLVTVRNQVERSKVIEVICQSPITLYAFYSSRFGTAGFTPLPVRAWGERYVAASWPAEVVRNIYPAGESSYDATEKKGGPAEIMIIAAYDNTEVTISPTGPLDQCNGCTEVTLNRGEAWIVQSMVDLRDGVDPDQQPDLAGTIIEASKPVGVVSANTRAQFEPLPFTMLAGNSVKDLAAEWLTPVEYHGASFAYTPAPPAPKGEVMRSAEEIRILPTVDATAVEIISGDSGWTMLDIALEPTSFVEVVNDSLERGSAIRMDGPGQAFQAIRSIAQFHGTTGSGNFTGSSYKAWGSAMSEIIPRERWTSFAPVSAPRIPSDFTSSMMVVTDTGSIGKILMQKGGDPSVPVDFPRRIAGTDLVWTRIQLDALVTYQLRGVDGARFTGTVYGEQEGYELFRPGGTRRDDDPKGSGVAAAHPSEYEESVGAAFAMPFPSEWCTLGGPRTYVIDTISRDCSQLTLRIRTDDGSNLDLKVLGLKEGSQNLRLFIQDTEGSKVLQWATGVIVQVSVFDPARAGFGVIEVRDWSREGPGESFEVRTDGPPRVEVDPEDFLIEEGVVGSGDSITLKNTGSTEMDVWSVYLKYDDRGFSILRTVPDISQQSSSGYTTIPPGDSVRVWLGYTPDGSDTAIDTLIVKLRCGNVAMQVAANPVMPCLEIGDLDFGLVSITKTITRSLEICNRGPGIVRFDSGAQPAIWDLPSHFSISPSDLDRLRNAELDNGDCIAIGVTFTSRELTGEFRSVARFLADPTGCRDSSVWRASVAISSVRGDREADGYRLLSLSPNPSVGDLTVSYEIPDARTTTITLIDPSGRELRNLMEEKQEAGVHRSTFDLGGLPSGLYFMRIRSGEWDVVEGVYVVR